VTRPRRPTPPSDSARFDSVPMWDPKQLFTASELQRIIRLAEDNNTEWRAYRTRYVHISHHIKGTAEYIDTLGAIRDRTLSNRRLIIKCSLALASA
jgi:hypothetical protein